MTEQFVPDNQRILPNSNGMGNSYSDHVDVVEQIEQNAKAEGASRKLGSAGLHTDDRIPRFDIDNSALY